jgi:hypothetical protein
MEEMMKATPKFAGSKMMILSLVALLAASWSSAAAQTLTPLSVLLAGRPSFTTINFPGAVTTNAYGINPAGDIVGSYVDVSHQEHGFVLRVGTFTPFDYPGSSWTQAWGITPQGDIVGQYGVSDVNYHGFLLRGDTFYSVDVPGQPSTMPIGVSPNGTIVGCNHGGLDGMHGFVMMADGVTHDPLAGTMHTGVNPSGDITGFYQNPPAGDRSYVISNGATSWFMVSGSAFTRARGISATGDVVGLYQDAATKKLHGFLLRHGELTSIDVDLPGVTQTRTFGINAEGDIVGNYVDATGAHGFLLSKRGQE